LNGALSAIQCQDRLLFFTDLTFSSVQPLIAEYQASGATDTVFEIFGAQVFGLTK